MLKKYLGFLLMTGFFLVTSNQVVVAQESVVDEVSQSEITVYPNPVNDGKIFISSSSESVKYIEIYDVLGKRVSQAEVRMGKPIDVGDLTPGVYIITINEDNTIATRKLVVR